MIELCERPARPWETRRLSAEEFCSLAQNEAGSLYRPRSEVLRMLAVGEAFGVCGAGRQPDAAMLVLPLEANVSAAAALREILGGPPRRRGFLLTPPVNGGSPRMERLLEAALAHTHRRAPGGPVWAVLECTPEAERLAPLYLARGFALRALRPLNSLSPCYLFAAGPAQAAGEGVWVELADATHLALLLGRGWAAVESRVTPEGCELRVVPTHSKIRGSEMV